MLTTYSETEDERAVHKYCAVASKLVFQQVNYELAVLRLIEVCPRVEK